MIKLLIHVLTIFQIIGKCAMDYGRLVLENLKKKGFYDDVGQFDVTDEVFNFFLYLQVEKKRNHLHSHTV